MGQPCRRTVKRNRERAAAASFEETEEGAPPARFGRAGKRSRTLSAACVGAQWELRGAVARRDQSQAPKESFSPRPGCYRPSGG
jgi:hypothetical protein